MSHGGDIYSKDIKYDFSVNLNPLGMPGPVKQVLSDAQRLSQLYPDIDYALLSDQISLHEKNNYRASVDADRIVVANGASSIINALGFYLTQKSVYIIEPCYTGYHRAFINTKAKVTSYDGVLSKYSSDDKGVSGIGTITDDDLSAIKKLRPDAVCLCNPANPSGQISDQKALEEVLDICRSIDAFLIVDECFMDLVSDDERISMSGFLSGYEKLVIIRAFTKTYAIPGLRLGYAFFGSERTAQVIRNMIPEWDVSSIAEAAGRAAMTDDEGYLKESRKLIGEEREYLSDNLLKMGITVYHSAACYMLIKCRMDLYEALINKGILIRRCDDYSGLPKEGYYRIAIKEREENDILLNALREIYDN